MPKDEARRQEIPDMESLAREVLALPIEDRLRVIGLLEISVHEESADVEWPQELDIDESSERSVRNPQTASAGKAINQVMQEHRTRIDAGKIHEPGSSANYSGGD